MEQKETLAANEFGLSAKEGKYLTFALGQEEYAVEILKIREIIGLLPITHLPGLPPHLKGIINLRGKIIPVTDLRLKFGMAEEEYTTNTCIIVLEVGSNAQGIIVDRVCEVCNIEQKNIEPPPDFGATIDTDFITGIGKVGDRVRILLDIQKVVGETEVVALKAAESLASA